MKSHQFVVLAVVLLTTVIFTDNVVNGGDTHASGVNKEAKGYACSCGTAKRGACQGVTGTGVIKGCPDTNQYRQCDAGVCTVKTCPTDQIWDKIQNACASCATGMHVAANKKICVCDQGNNFKGKNKPCVQCPTGSTQEADRCSCPVNTVLDDKTKACKICPTGSTLSNKRVCVCNNPAQFWCQVAWTCKDCPGEWLPKNTKKVTKPSKTKCTCTGANSVFDRISVTCVTCPTGSTAAPSRDTCTCSNRLHSFNRETQKCECKKGFSADAAGTGCVSNKARSP